MKLPRKEETFSDLFSAFLKPILNSEHFQKNMKLLGYVLTKIRTSNDIVRQMSKSPFSENATRRDMANGPKHC